MEKTIVSDKVDELLSANFNNDSFFNAYLIETNNVDQTLVSNKIIEYFFKSEVNADDIYVLDYKDEVIKKENIFELKKYFSTKSIHNSKRIYIIKNADNMNLSFSNSLLKFLEEPEENLHAILISNKIVTIPDTITSRCQVIRLPKIQNSFENDEIIDSYMMELKNSNYGPINNRKEYITYFKEITYNKVLSYILNKEKENLLETQSKGEIGLVKAVLSLLEESKISYNEELFYDRMTILLTRFSDEK